MYNKDWIKSQSPENNIYMFYANILVLEIVKIL
jgi:hypothetical protein